jgi:hypothetical protein
MPAVEVDSDQILSTPVGVVEQPFRRKQDPARAIGVGEQCDARLKGGVARQAIPAERTVEQGGDHDRASRIHRDCPGCGRHSDCGDLLCVAR